MRRRYTIMALAFLGWLLLAGAVCAQESDAAATNTVQVAVLLAPLVAAATAVERIIEMVVSWYEGVMLNASRWLGLGGGYVKWMREDIQAAQKAVIALSHKGAEATAADLTALRKAEESLAAAQDRLVEWLKSPFYTNGKRLATLLMGIILGVILAFSTRLRMLALLGIQPGDVAPNLANLAGGIDMLLTGLVIGTGSAPVHSLIGLLQNTKDAVDQARALWSGKALTEAAAALGQAQAAAAPRGIQPAMDIAPAGAPRSSAPAPQPEGEIEFLRRAKRMLR